MRPIVSFKAFDVVVVPFPFTDRSSTTHPDWPLDIEVRDRDAAGLPSASIVRMKLFTLDDRFSGCLYQRSSPAGYP
jgi:mRNA interferase MazF